MEAEIMTLLDDDNFGKDAISKEVGLMIYKSTDVVNFLMLQYVDRWEVYLNYYDDGKPYRNILVKGTSRKLEIAKNIAVRKLEKAINTHVH